MRHGLTQTVCAHLSSNVNSLLIVKDQLNLFHEFLVNRVVIVTELVKGCSRRRSLGNYTVFRENSSFKQ